MHTLPFFFVVYISKIVHLFLIFFTVNSSVRLEHLSSLNPPNKGPAMYISAEVLCVKSSSSSHCIKTDRHNNGNVDSHRVGPRLLVS